MAGCHPLTTPAPQSTPTDALVVARSPFVVDGDTLGVVVDGKERRVRLLGIDAPESGDCGADAAADRLAALVDVDHLHLVLDPDSGPEDRYGRILAYATTPDVDDVGLALIDEGLVEAWWPRSAAPPSRGDAYTAAADAARQATTGSWAECGALGR